MTKQELIAAFHADHRQMIDYILALTPKEFAYSHNGKWTAGQQLEHIHLCLKPLVRTLASKDFIVQNFGTIDRPTWSYDTVIDTYLSALAKGGKAPEKFVPQQSLEPIDGAAVAAGLAHQLDTIAQQLDDYTDEELDSLVLPHPLLGKLTIREMFYLMTYHATHHHRQAEQNLRGVSDSSMH